MITVMLTERFFSLLTMVFGVVIKNNYFFRYDVCVFEDSAN